MLLFLQFFGGSRPLTGSCLFILTSQGEFLFIPMLRQFYRFPCTQFMIFNLDEEFRDIAGIAHLFKFSVSVFIGFDVGVINEQPRYAVGGFVRVFVELIIPDCNFSAGCYFSYVFGRAEKSFFPYAV